MAGGGGAESVSWWVSIPASVGTSLVFVTVLARWLWRRFVNAVAEAISRLESKITPNGGDTRQVGDTAMRTEDMVRELYERAFPGRTAPTASVEEKTP